MVVPEIVQDGSPKDTTPGLSGHMKGSPFASPAWLIEPLVVPVVDDPRIMLIRSVTLRSGLPLASYVSRPTDMTIFRRQRRLRRPSFTRVTPLESTTFTPLGLTVVVP